MLLKFNSSQILSVFNFSGIFAPYKGPFLKILLLIPEAHMFFLVSLCIVLIQTSFLTQHTQIHIYISDTHKKIDMLPNAFKKYINLSLEVSEIYTYTTKLCGIKNDYEKRRRSHTSTNINMFFQSHIVYKFQ